jgi:hypothetical protein
MGTEPGDIIPHKRWLALLEGGLLPLISLTSLHFYTKYQKTDNDTTQKPNNPTGGVLNLDLNQEPTISVTPMEEPDLTNNTDDSEKPLGKYDLKFGPEYTKTMEDIHEEIKQEEEDEVVEIIKEQPKKIYNNVLDVDVQEEPEEDIVEDELPIPEQERQKHLKFRKRLISKNTETQDINTDDSRRVEVIDGGRKALIYPKRDKITQKRIK